LGTKIDLQFQETCDLVITKQVEESVATMERDVDDLIGFRVAEKFDDLAKQDTDETAANIFDSVQGQVAEQVQSEIAVVRLEMTALAKQCLHNMEACEERFSYIDTMGETGKKTITRVIPAHANPLVAHDGSMESCSPTGFNCMQKYPYKGPYKAQNPYKGST
jgi:hypothetical protein